VSSVSGPSRNTEICITIDAVDSKRVAAFWAEALGYHVERERHPYGVLMPDEGVEGPEVLIQKVDAVTPGKTRVHIDLVVDDREAEVQRMLALGAGREGEVEDSPGGGSRWTVMTDPEGTHFCVVQREAAGDGS
jgi:predicted enzyme related to lactoylglutathione lyase